MQDGRFDEAEAILSVAIRSFPNDYDTMLLAASIAHNRQDRANAVRRWKSVRDRFPDSPQVRVGYAVALRDDGQFEAAESLLADGREKFGDDLSIAVEFASLADSRCDFASAASRWRRAHDQFPDDQTSHVRLAIAMEHMNEPAEADHLLSGARLRFPNDPQIFYAEAILAKRRQDWEACWKAWKRVAELHDQPGVFAEWGNALRNAGRLNDAQTLLVHAADRFPNSFEILHNLATTHGRLGAWQQAIATWLKLKQQFADHPLILDEVTKVVWEAKLYFADDDVALAELEPAFVELASELFNDNEKTVNHNLLMSFESMGYGCEFGLVQRRYGAEPLGLLRWSGMSPDNIIKALGDKFEGVDDPSQTEIYMQDYEYFARTVRYGLLCHTFVFVNDMPIEKLRTQHYRRASFLKRKLIEDLESNEKIFVYSWPEVFGNEKMLEIYSAISKYSSSARLMCVRLADSDHLSGTTELVRSNLVVGYIDKFAVVGTSFDAWISLCKSAARLLAADCPS